MAADLPAPGRAGIRLNVSQSAKLDTHQAIKRTNTMVSIHQFKISIMATLPLLLVVLLIKMKPLIGVLDFVLSAKMTDDI